MTTAGTRPAAPTAEQIRAAWDGVAAGFDAHMTALNIEAGDKALRRVEVGPGTRVLDVAAGTGALAISAARRGAQVVATDISPAMAERLVRRARAEGLDVTAHVMDGHALDLDDDTFDVAASQHGVSLFPDVDCGLRELVRVTRPGGRVVIIAFGQPHKAEFLTFFLGALRAAVPGFAGLPLDPPPLPFQVADPDVLGDKLESAGLAGVQVEPEVWDLPIRSAAHLWDVVRNSNPIGAQMVAGLTPEQSAEAQRVLDGMLRERSEGSPDAVLHVDLNIGLGTV